MTRHTRNTVVWVFPESDRRKSDSTSLKLAAFLGVTCSELIVHAVHMMSASALTAFVDSHMDSAQRHSLWHDAILDWLPTAAAVASLGLLYRHLKAHTSFFYVSRLGTGSRL